MRNSEFKTLGLRLKELRENANLMQRQVGSVIDVDGAFISKIENNEKPINRDHLKKLSVFFNVKESELQILWLIDKINNTLKDEPFAKEAVKVIYTNYIKKNK